PPKKKQKKITASFESIEIENSKVKRINHALTRLFVCCGIPFSIVSNPFFIDFVKSLCPAYELPNCVTFAGSWVNQELQLSKQSYKSGALLSEEIKNNFIEGGGLKGYCVTRWTTSFECLQSILRCERALHNVFEKNPDTLSTEVKEIIRNRIFFQDVEELIKVIQPIKDVLT